MFIGSIGELHSIIWDLGFSVVFFFLSPRKNILIRVLDVAPDPLIWLLFLVFKCVFFQKYSIISFSKNINLPLEIFHLQKTSSRLQQYFSFEKPFVLLSPFSFHVRKVQTFLLYDPEKGAWRLQRAPPWKIPPLLTA